MSHMEINTSNLVRQAADLVNKSSQAAYERQNKKASPFEKKELDTQSKPAAAIELQLSGRQKTKELGNLQTAYTRNQVRMEEVRELQKSGVKDAEFELDDRVPRKLPEDSLTRYHEKLQNNVESLGKEIIQKQNEFENIFALSGFLNPLEQSDLDKLRSSNVMDHFSISRSNVLSLLKES